MVSLSHPEPSLLPKNTYNYKEPKRIWQTSTQADKTRALPRPGQLSPLSGLAGAMVAGAQAQGWGGLLAPAPSWLPRGVPFLWAQNLCCPAVTGAAWPFLPNLVVTHIPRPQADSCRSSSTSGIHMWLALFRKGGHIWLQKQEDPQGASDPREGQQASEASCCMLLSCLCPILSTRGCPGDMALPRNYYQ